MYVRLVGRNPHAPGRQVKCETGFEGKGRGEEEGLNLGTVSRYLLKTGGGGGEGSGQTHPFELSRVPVTRSSSPKVRKRSKIK